MKNHYLTLLRDKETGVEEFRKAVQNLSSIVAAEVASQLPTLPFTVTTPLGVCPGEKIQERIVLVVILRAGLALLPPFVKLFPNAPIGFFGIQRDKKTFLPHLYYENLPAPSNNDRVLLLDPMLATGKTAIHAITHLKEKFFDPSRIHLVTIIAAREGMLSLEKACREVKIYTVAIDEQLNVNKYIVPGLGDFGDRYFGVHDFKENS